MKPLLKLAYQLYQLLFYIFIVISFVAFVFWFFGRTPFRTVGYLILFTFAFLFLHIVFINLYHRFYEEPKLPIPSHLEEEKD